MSSAAHLTSTVIVATVLLAASCGSGGSAPPPIPRDPLGVLPSEWNQPGGNGANQHRDNYDGPATVSSTDTVELGSGSAGTLAFSRDSAVYIGGSKLTALDTDLSLLWEHQPLGKPSWGPAVLSNGDVFYCSSQTISDPGSIGPASLKRTSYRLDPEGSEVWSAAASAGDDNLQAAKLGSGDTLYEELFSTQSVESWEASIRAVDLNTGNELWSFALPSWHCGLVLGSGSGGDMAYYAVSAWLDAAGNPTTEFGYGAGEPEPLDAASLSLGPDGSLYGNYWGYENANGNIVLRPGSIDQPFEANSNEIAIDPSGAVYLFRNGDCCCVDTDDTERWRISPDWAYPDAARPPHGSGGVTIHSNVCVDGAGRSYWTAAGIVWALSPEGGFLWSQQLPDSTHRELAVGPNGGLYIPMTSGKLVVIR